MIILIVCLGRNCLFPPGRLFERQHKKQTADKLVCAFMLFVVPRRAWRAAHPERRCTHNMGDP
jgi:hypothetical protein